MTGWILAVLLAQAPGVIRVQDAQIPSQGRACDLSWGRETATALIGDGSFQRASRVLWGGENKCGDDHQIAVNVWRVSGTGTCTVRVRDVRNGTTLCTVTTQVPQAQANDAAGTVVCGPVTNAPAAHGPIELQISSELLTTCNWGGWGWLSHN